MKILYDLFGDDMTLAYLDIQKETARNKLQEIIDNDEISLELSPEDSLEECACDDSLDEMMPNIDAELDLNDN